MQGLYPDSFGLEVIREHTMGLADLAAANDPMTPVPTCGDWRLADLTWHLTEVQDFWAHVISRRPEGPETYDRPVRSVDEALPARLAETTGRLLAALEHAPIDEYAWSWSSDHTVGFTVRRQSHEALVHHIDGLLAVGQPVPTVPPELAADGVDEIVDIMLCDLPKWATFTPHGKVITLVTTDTGDAWTVGLGEGSGTPPGGDPQTTRAVERLPSATRPDATFRAAGRDLLLWLWGRLDAAVLGIEGNADLATELRSALVESTE